MLICRVPDMENYIFCRCTQSLSNRTE